MTEPIVLSLGEPVRTERLVLRTLVPGDAETVYAYRSLPELARYVPFEPMTREQIVGSLAGRWSLSRVVGEGHGLLVGVVRADTAEPIGDLSLMLASDEHRGGEIGWTLHPDHGGRGYATEAARAGLGIMFAAGVRRIVARVDARNGPSLALCERLGMRREAVLLENEWFKGEWSDEVDYALLDREWAARQASVEAGDPGAAEGAGAGGGAGAGRGAGAG